MLFFTKGAILTCWLYRTRLKSCSQRLCRLIRGFNISCRLHGPIGRKLSIASGFCIYIVYLVKYVDLAACSIVRLIEHDEKMHCCVQQKNDDCATFERLLSAKCCLLHHYLTESVNSHLFCRFWNTSSAGNMLSREASSS